VRRGTLTDDIVSTVDGQGRPARRSDTTLLHDPWRQRGGPREKDLDGRKANQEDAGESQQGDHPSVTPLELVRYESSTSRVGPLTG
jgi:hypothetical protein